MFASDFPSFGAGLLVNSRCAGGELQHRDDRTCSSYFGKGFTLDLVKVLSS